MAPARKRGDADMILMSVHTFSRATALYLYWFIHKIRFVEVRPPRRTERRMLMSAAESPPPRALRHLVEGMRIFISFSIDVSADTRNVDYHFRVLCSSVDAYASYRSL